MSCKTTKHKTITGQPDTAQKVQQYSGHFCVHHGMTLVNQFYGVWSGEVTRPNLMGQL